MKGSWSVMKGPGYIIRVTSDATTSLNRKRTLMRFALLRYGLMTKLLLKTPELRVGECPLSKAWGASPEKQKPHRPDSFRVFLNRGRWACEACGREGGVVEFVAMRESVPQALAAVLILNWFPASPLRLARRQKRGRPRS